MELVEKLDNLGLRETLDRSLKQSMITLENNTKRNTPVDTWLLRNSFETTFPSKLVGVLNNFREYALYVQEGTKFMRANDFLSKWVEASERSIERIFNKNIDNLLASL